MNLVDQTHFFLLLTNRNRRIGLCKNISNEKGSGGWGGGDYRGRSVSDVPLALEEQRQTRRRFPTSQQPPASLAFFLLHLFPCDSLRFRRATNIHSQFLSPFDCFEKYVASIGSGTGRKLALQCRCQEEFANALRWPWVILLSYDRRTNH